ncbi:MAG: hypothetical protein WEF99_12730 [Thermoanaerobaculia bacterium]
MNRNMLRAIPTALCVLIAVSPIACKKREVAAPPVVVEPTALPMPTPAPAVTVTDVSLGKSLGADKKVAAAMDTFKPRDTIFAVVQTDGSAASSVINVKWIYQDGQVVKEDSRTIAVAGPAVTEFSIQKASGWPKGDYKVEIVVDGQPPTTKSFKVQ